MNRLLLEKDKRKGFKSPAALFKQKSVKISIKKRRGREEDADDDWLVKLKKQKVPQSGTPQYLQFFGQSPTAAALQKKQVENSMFPSASSASTLSSSFAAPISFAPFVSSNTNTTTHNHYYLLLHPSYHFLQRDLRSTRGFILPLLIPSIHRNTSHCINDASPPPLISSLSHIPPQEISLLKKKRMVVQTSIPPYSQAPQVLITDHVVSILRIYHLHHHLLIILWVGWSV
jgi:hypothetical protein